jgi:hypothetical protein
MYTIRTIPPRHQEQAPKVGIPVRPATPSKRRPVYQRLHRWYTGRRLERLRRLNDLWDASHERVQVQATEDRLDYITRTKPRLGLEIYVTFS